MNTELLAKFVKNTKYFSPLADGCPHVLDAIKAIDRKLFIPSNLVVVLSSVPDLEARMEIVSQQLVSIQGGLLTGDSISTEDVDKAFKALHLLGDQKELAIDLRDLAYNDLPFTIGHNQTCSQPSVVAIMSAGLVLKKGLSVLEVGSGCGYHAAITSHIVGEEGHVVSIETIPELHELAKENMCACFGDDYEKRVTLVLGDGSVGYEGEFDRIYLTAGVDLGSFNPSVLSKFLKREGILMYPEKVGDLIKKRYEDGKCVSTYKQEGYMFVPLVGENV